MQKIIATTVQRGARVNKELLESIDVFRKEHGVDRVVAFVLKGKYVDDNMLDSLIQETDWIELVSEGEEKINENLKLYHSQVPAQNIKPLNGLKQKLPTSYNYILPATKVRYLSIPSQGTYPRCLITTGALTHPNYKENTMMGVKAKEQHQYGFTYLEVTDNKTFIPHPIIANKNGSYYHLDKRYDAEAIEQQIAALVVPDWHNGDTARIMYERTHQLISEYKPKYVVLHDFFNGHSINHHEEYDMLAQVRNVTRDRIGLEKEVIEAYDELVKLASASPDSQFIVVNSNHDEFITRYIASGRFAQDPLNFVFGCKLAPELVDIRAVALQKALETVGKLPKNVRFLKKGETFKIYGNEVGLHGHQGANGSRGTGNQFASNNIVGATAHSHTPMMEGNHMVVGTATNLDLDYTLGGITSWMWAFGLIYKDGNRTLLTVI